MEIGIVGFGEVGKIFARALAKLDDAHNISVWDIRWKDSAADSEDIAAITQSNLHACASVAALCERSALIFSSVTASNAESVAAESAPQVSAGTYFIDLNSASPGTKQRSAALIAAAGGHYLDAGVMTSVPPYGIAAPILLGGACAAEIAPMLKSWGMNVTVVSAEIGVASAIKMSRSILIKGLEALVIESYTNARAYGVEDYVLPTFAETFPSIDWEKQGDYFFSRVVQHGKRRAEEMFEATNTVREIGLEPLMATATAQRQAWISAQRKAGVVTPGAKSWRTQADALLAARNKVTLD